MNFRMKAVGLSLIASAALMACGGGGGGGTAATPASIDGVAAVGAPLPNATVKLKGANNVVLTTTASATGAYTFADVSTLTAPMMLQAIGTAGGVVYTLHSMLPVAPAAGVRGVLNVTPATESVMAQATGQDPAAVFAVASEIAKVTPVSLTDAKAKVIAALADVLTALGLTPANVDLFTTAFTANGAGLDKLLDTIQFQSAPNSTGGQDIRVANKNPGSTVAVIMPATVVGSVPKVVAPTKLDLDLNTASIKAFIDAFNANVTPLTGTQTEAMATAMADLFDDAYLDKGDNKTAQLVDLKTHAVGVKMLDYVLQGCNGETKICKGEISLLQKDGKTIEQFPMPVKLGANGKWRAYGNQSPFDFDLKPVAQANYTVSGSTAGTPSVSVGFNFWFTGKVGNSSARTYNSARLFARNHGDESWGLVASFKPKLGCNVDWLPLENSSSDCGNFQSVTDDVANANNAARLTGKREFKIEAFTSFDYTGIPVKHEQYAKKDLFTTTTGTAAITNSGMSITAADLGTNSVRFAGPVRDLSINVVTPNSSAQGFTNWDDNKTAGLAGIATVAKAKDLCDTNLNLGCESSYGLNAVINRINLYARDAQGRGIWVNYFKNMQSTSGSTSGSVSTPGMVAGVRG